MIRINGKEEQLKEPFTIKDLLEEKGVDPGGVIVVKNGLVVRREDWPQILIRDGDDLEILKLLGGG